MVGLSLLLGVLLHCQTGPQSGGSSKAARGPSGHQENRSPKDKTSAPDSMVLIPAGQFWMGHEQASAAEGPRNQVTLDAYAIDRTEVTAQDYAACVQKKRCTQAKKRPRCTGADPKKTSHPINCVTWKQAKEYCRFRKKRLPTEAEWERAARGTQERKYVWGKKWPPPKGAGNFSDRSAGEEMPYWHVVSNYTDGYVATAPVGRAKKDQTKEGVFDLAGNVMEWVHDVYNLRTYRSRDRKNPKGPKWGKAKSVRGASFGRSRAVRLEAAHRSFYRPDAWSAHIGFRCVRDVPKPSPTR